MSMTKKDFEALAGELRPLAPGRGDADDVFNLWARTLDALCRFGAAQNSLFDKKRFIASIDSSEAR